MKGYVRIKDRDAESQETNEAHAFVAPAYYLERVCNLQHKKEIQEEPS